MPDPRVVMALGEGVYIDIRLMQFQASRVPYGSGFFSQTKESGFIRNPVRLGSFL